MNTMEYYSPYTIELPSTDKETKKYISDISSRIYNMNHGRYYYTNRSIFDDYYECKQCYVTFQVLELIEKYHEFLKSCPELFDFYFVMRKKIRSFIKEVQSRVDKCKCCIAMEIDSVDEDTGFIYLKEYEDDELEVYQWKASLFRHYTRLLNEPNVLNEEIILKGSCNKKISLKEDDNHLGLIFNDDDKIHTYQGQYTPYNTRYKYRLQQRNFLKLSIHSYVSDNHTFVTSVAELHRDNDAIVKELQFWDEYFSKTHTLLVTSVLSLKGKINNDCIYNIIGFLKCDKSRSVGSM